ncbi:MAG: hypothetical protein NZM31_06425 [Gemmatales bacterium]|nr:hypothetical protein [Gemmatales bacterium]MDW8386635.1 hypothetical protein [Gemmatales bacterium]
MRQVFEIERIRQVKGKRATREVVDGFTSLGPEEAGPAELLTVSRKHWAIKNKLYGCGMGC